MTRPTPKAREDRWGSLRSELDSPAVPAHPAGKADLAGWLCRQVDRRGAGRGESTVEVGRGEDDALGAGVLVVTPEDQSQGDARPGHDRVRVVAAVDDDIDDLAAVGTEACVGGLHVHGYVCPATRSSVTTGSRMISI